MAINRSLGGVLLVSGTAIGAGMLALPIVSGAAGMIPSLLLLSFFWIYMTYTAFLMLEVHLWIPSDSNLISMAHKTLGKRGELLSWFIFLFLLYALETAYISVGSSLIHHSLAEWSPFSPPEGMGLMFLWLLFGLVVSGGTAWVDRLNRGFMVGLLLTYLIIVCALSQHVDMSRWQRINPLALSQTVSVVATSFGFHIIIPTLASYLRRDLREIKWVLMVGSFLPLLVYLLWNSLALGILPLEGPQGILEGYQQGESAASLLGARVGDPYLTPALNLFALLAIITSFLGVSLSLTDFLADGLKIKKEGKGHFFLYFLVFFPPMTFSYLHVRAFLSALEVAGAFGVTTLLGLIPACMTWAGRYHLGLNQKAHFTTPGGKVGLIATMLVSVAVILIELINKIG